jgi:hypothetical protein
MRETEVMVVVKKDDQDQGVLTIDAEIQREVVRESTDAEIRARREVTQGIEEIVTEETAGLIGERNPARSLLKRLNHLGD